MATSMMRGLLLCHLMNGVLDQMKPGTQIQVQKFSVLFKSKKKLTDEAVTSTLYHTISYSKFLPLASKWKFNAIVTAYQQMAFLLMSSGEVRSLRLHFTPFIYKLPYIHIDPPLPTLPSVFFPSTRIHQTHTMYQALS